MAAQFIQVSLDDFEKRFNIPNKNDPTRRAFDLIRPDGEEAYYICQLRKRNEGTLNLKLLTTIRSDRRKARNCGEDAIRCFILWEDKNEWTVCVGKTTRIYRSGGVGATADTVIKRAFDKAKMAALESVKLPYCSCGRPKVLRSGINGEFWGCSSYKYTGCKGR